MISKAILRYCQAIALRLSLYVELRKALRSKSRLPKSIKRRIWTEPHNQQEYLWLLRFISNNEQVTLIDIGGNSGYWAETFREYYPKSLIYAFEPVPEMYNQYTQKFAHDNRVKVVNTALGNEEGHKSINIAKGYGLSSFNTYSEELDYRNVHFIEKRLVNISTLDRYLSDITFRNIIIKVDVQGYEINVLQGGMAVFAKADLVIIECSFSNEFKGELPTFGSVTAMLRDVDLHPIRFGVYDKLKGPIAYERNVLFVRGEYLDKIWGY